MTNLRQQNSVSIVLSFTNSSQLFLIKARLMIFGPALFRVVETGLVFRAFCTVNDAVKIKGTDS